MNPLLVVDLDSSLHSCMHNELWITRKAVKKFLPAQFSQIWFKSLAFEAILSIQRFSNQAEYREVIVKNSLLITHAGMQIRIWYWLFSNNRFINGILGDTIDLARL